MSLFHQHFLVKISIYYLITRYFWILSCTQQTFKAPILLMQISQQIYKVKKQQAIFFIIYAGKTMYVYESKEKSIAF
jgi:hypothetical protein